MKRRLSWVFVAICGWTVAACGDTKTASQVDATAADTGSATAAEVAGDTTATAEDTTADTASTTATGGDTATVSDSGADTTATSVDTTVATDATVADTAVEPDTAVAPETTVEPDTAIEPETTVATDTTVAPDTAPVIGTQLVAGAGLVLEDVAEDGAYLAYTDLAHNLYHVKLADGSATLIASGVDKARYKGKFLFVFKGVDAGGKTAGTMLVAPEGTATPSLTTALVKINTVIASPDGNHYLFERAPNDTATTDDVYLDGTRIFSDATTTRQAFSPTSNYLVASSFYKDAVSGNKMKVLRAWPLTGGQPKVLVSDGAASRFSITPDGQKIVVGLNDTGPTADLTAMAISGGAGTLLASGGRDKQFRVMGDGTTFVFMDANTSGLNHINLNGSGLGVVVASAVDDLEAVSSSLVVYATATDAATGFKTLRAVKKDGTKDTALGDMAVNEGFSPDEAYLTYRDAMLGTEGDLGLLVVATMKTSQLATGVVKTSVADNTRVVYLDSAGFLHVAVFATGAKTTLEDFVTYFKLVSDGIGQTTKSRVAFAVSGDAPGIYVAPL